MVETPSRKVRPQYRNINAFKDLTTYRLPLAGWVSILHRVSGALMFLLLPLVVWLFDRSITSEISFVSFQNAVSHWFVKLILLGLIWAYLHHFIAGVRHLWMDAFHTVTKQQGTQSAVVTLGLSLALTAVFALKLFGAF
ncbi:MAG: succinate dehydrogenase, cytochrome b556 subunit [Betaproteobacteria bacterium]|nr:succinate dehydrogenase, cytochrome b556 subunit [Betaproteobacteria bacterium]MDE2048150.1 succinate dehydrogenase, cytochrome b556 subunit [Betaproteobacteria bacterium]